MLHFKYSSDLVPLAAAGYLCGPELWFSDTERCIHTPKNQDKQFNNCYNGKDNANNNDRPALDHWGQGASAQSPRGLSPGPH